MLNKIGNVIGFDESFEDSKIILFGAPFDGTTSYRPGTRFASNAIRVESDAGMETYSPYLDKDLMDYALHDAGDLDFQLGNRDKILGEIEEFTKDVVEQNKVPFIIGGEHLVSYPAIKAVHDQYKDLVVIHLDAHTDLREEYLGEQYSHATVMKRVWDLVGDRKIYQYGIRSGEKNEFLWAEEHTFLSKFSLEGFDSLPNLLSDTPVYITLDLDVFDPSAFPGTGTPEAGGINFKDFADILEDLDKLNIVGADMVELSPHYDSSGASTLLACKVLREMVLAILE